MAENDDTKTLAGQSGPANLGTPSENPAAGEGKGVLAQHRERVQNDKAYAEAALTIAEDSPATTAKKTVPSTVPTSLSADHQDD